jgi:hypothetical protein
MAETRLSPLEKAASGYRWESARARLLQRACRFAEAAAAQDMASEYQRQLADAGLFASEVG